MSFPKPLESPFEEETPAKQVSHSDLKSRSLRAELTISHAGLVALIVIGFGAALFVTIVRASYRQAEADLLGAAQMMVEDLKDGTRPRDLKIPESYKERFGKAHRDRAYFALWNDRGDLLSAKSSLPAQAIPSEAKPPLKGRHAFVSRYYGKHLDIIVNAPNGAQLLIGRPLAREFDGLARLAAELMLIGSLCLLVGFIGASWLARRISGPIARMAESAESITARNLDRRLEADSSPREISRLARSFNTMLDGLHQAFDRQIRFTADASHELRTPVSIILAQAEHSLSRERSAEDYQAALRTCLRASKRMKTLVDDLLLLAKTDSGRLDLKIDRVDLAEVVGKTVDLLEPLAIKSHVNLQVNLETAIVMGDSGRLGQVVTNLVGNAIRYNVPGGDVWIKVVSTQGSGEASLIVGDNGQGIPSIDQARLFDRFHRVDQARAIDDETGSGLGLSLVAEIVDAHQGSVRVSSEIGKGTTMTVLLPLASPSTPSPLND